MVWKRTLHPGSFAYGSLHTYVLALAAVTPVHAYKLLFDQQPDAARNSEAHEAWEDRQEVRVIVLARSISALLAAAQVFLTCMIGIIAFGEMVGLLAALLLAVSPYFVGIAHFATVDTAANFWYWLSALFAFFILRQGGSAWYTLAALAAGLATGIKADRLLAVFSLLAAHVLRGEGLHLRKLLIFAFFVPAGYLLANPWFFISPFEFLDGTTRDLFFNIMREPQGSGNQFVQMLFYMSSGLGLPLFISAIGGMICAIYNVSLGRDRAVVGLLFVMFLPYYLLYGSRYAIVWYVPFLFPALALFAAYGFVSLFSFVGPRYAAGAATLIAVVAGFSLLKAIAFDLQLVNDSRYLAAAWIDRHAPDHATIGVGPRGPLIPEDRYRLVKRSMDPRYYEFVLPWYEELERHTLYQKIRGWILDLEQFGEKFGIPKRQQPYRAWFDNRSEQLQTVAADPEQWRKERPDYFVLLDYLESERISALRDSDSDYRLVARIQYENPFGFDVSFPFVNPLVYVFQRQVGR